MSVFVCVCMHRCVCVLGKQAASQKLRLEDRKQANWALGHYLNFPTLVLDHLLLNEREHWVLITLMANLPC